MRVSLAKRAFIGAVLMILSAGVAMAIAFGLDRVVGQFAPDPRLTAGLLYPPQMEIAHKNYEFDVTIRTNALGLRGAEYDPADRPEVLVAVLGDSYTFGWGVEAEETWVARVESSLRANGPDVRVLNFGQPGGSPITYAHLAETALPLLKPDLVVVGLLQTDDIMQSDPATYSDPAAIRREPALSAWIRSSFPHLTALAYRERAQHLAGREATSAGNWRLLTGRWKDDFRRLQRTFDDGARKRFRALPAPIQQGFREGEINPVYARFVAYPTANSDAHRSLTVDAPEMQAQIGVASKCLDRIRAAAESWGGHAIAISVPGMPDNDPAAMALWREYFGATYVPSKDDVRADEAVRQAAGRAGLPVHDVTAAFREVSWAEPLFYPVDSHMTRRGNEVFADLIAPAIEPYVQELQNR